MYERILVAIDATPSDENVTLKRAVTFAKQWGAIVHLLHVGRGHILPADITGGNRIGLITAQDDGSSDEIDTVRKAVDILTAAGIETHGELVNATQHDIAETILQRAEELRVDLIVLGQEHHRGTSNAFKTSVAAQVIRQHPSCSILLAKPQPSTA